MDERIRKKSHFDDEIFINEHEIYYYRGTPYGSKTQIEKSLKLRVGATQKDVIRNKKDLLDSLQNIGPRLGRSSSQNIFKQYVAFREKEAESPEVLSRSSFKETKNIVINHFIPWFMNLRVEHVDQDAFDGYAEAKFKKGLELRNHRKVLNHFLKWCVRNKFLKTRPEIQLLKQFTKKKRQRIILSDDQVRSIFKNSNEKLTLYISMYLFMGMRNMEICQLRWDEIDFKNRALRVNPFSNRKRKSRVIPINSAVIDMLRVKQINTDSPYVFPNEVDKSRPMHKSSIRKPWKALLANSEVDTALTPHDLRATFETHMHRNKNFTDTQREKMAGAAIDVQKNIYITMDADALRGLENSVDIKGISKLLKMKLGKSLGKSTSKKRQRRA